MQGQRMDGMGTGAVYVQSNELENEVIAFSRGMDGALTRIGSYATGGKGDGVPHLTSQGSVVLTGDGRHVLVTNAASNDLSVFGVVEGGLELVQTVPAGESPKSVAEHRGVVYVLNTGKPNVTGLRMGEGTLVPIIGSERALSAGNADPAQVSFSPDGATLLVTERGTDSIVSYRVGEDGLLEEPRVHPSSGPTPYGFAFTSDGNVIVTEAFRAEKGAAAASSYKVRDGALASITASAGNGRSEICWAVVTVDDRFVFTTNFADGAVSRYAIGADGTITLEDAVAGLTEDGRPGLRDEDLTTDGRFLYAIDADSGSLFGWEVGQDGTLSLIGSWDGLPLTVAGLAAS